MIMRNILLAAALTFTPLSPVFSQENLKLGSPEARITLEKDADRMLVEMLMKAKNSIFLEKDIKTLRFPFVCPHAMFALTAIASGAVDPEAGAKFFVSGLLKDREEMVSMHITGQPGFDLMKSDATIHVGISENVSRDQLANILDMGIGFMGP